MILLTPHKQNDPENTDQVMVDIKFDGEFLHVHFEVKASDLNLSNDFNTENWDNIGLWNFDVVEVFLQKKDNNNHYLELEISPKGQKLAILVKRPREDFHQLEPIDTLALASLTETGFWAEFKVKATDIPGDGDVIVGNAHACLGKNPRNYFSLFEGDTSKPDFHRPEFFQSVENI